MQPRGEFEAVDIRHDDVREHEVDVDAFLDFFQRFAGRADERHHAAEGFQELPGGHRTVRVVVDDEDASAFGDRLRTFGWISHRISGKILEQMKNIPSFAADANLYGDSRRHIAWRMSLPNRSSRPRCTRARSA